jgi:hypothetical protein
MGPSSTADATGVYLSPGVSAAVRDRAADDRRVEPMDGFLSWWDGVELWLSGLGFVLQTIVVMPVVLLLAYGIAVLLDGSLGKVVTLVRWLRGKDRSPR